MRKTILMIITLLAGALGAPADNTLSVGTALIPQGKTGSFNIELTNTDTFTAFQMDLTLPEGIIFVAATKGNRYADDHSLGVASNGQTTRFTMNSSTNKPITGNGGALITVTVAADEALEPGTLLQATLGNIEMAQLVNDKERKKVTPPDLDFDIEITDKVILDENSAVAPTAQQGVDVIVRRSIKSGSWSTIVLPFALTKAKAQAAFGSDAQIASFDGFAVEYASEDDLTPLSIRIDLKASAIGIMAAGRPYLIKTTKDIESFEVENVNVSSTPREVSQDEENMGLTMGKLTGTFVATTIPENGLFVSNNQFWYSTGKTKTKAFRCWFELDDVLNQETSLEARSIRLNIIDDGLTAISDVEQQAADDKLSGCYDLQGRRIAPVKKGIYVRNGKKVIIK